MDNDLYETMVQCLLISEALTFTLFVFVSPCALELMYIHPIESLRAVIM